MPVVLDATVGGPNANSYCTLAEANAYQDTHPYGATWTALADDDQKSRALILATRLLDSNIEWHRGSGWIASAGIVGGGVVSMTQALLWPRYGVVGRNGFVIDSTVIPRELKEAAAEFARQLLAKDRTVDSKAETEGLKRMVAGPVEFEFENPQAKVIPDAVFYMVQHLGRLIQRGAGNVPVTRAY